MKQEEKIFEDFLKKQELKLTSQRQIILNRFLNIEKHLGAEELYDLVKKKNPEIGLVTVFRTLKLIKEAGLAREVNFGDKTIRYEHKYNHEHHDHLICTKCGSYIEAVDLNIEKLQDKLCKKLKFTPINHRLEIFGICKECTDKKLLTN
jgi:Fur family transcriptional regulator, ferric uptake regulator